MKQLTKKQLRVYDYIKSYTERERYSPSFREVGEHFGVSIGAISFHIHALKKKGFIEFTPGASRTIRIL